MADHIKYPEFKPCLSPILINSKIFEAFIQIFVIDNHGRILKRARLAGLALVLRRGIRKPFCSLRTTPRSALAKLANDPVLATLSWTLKTMCCITFVIRC